MTLSPETQTLSKLDVVCAVVRKGDQYLACQRSETMREPLHWEFPGGKIEVGETLIQALHREVAEELSAKVTIRGILRPSFIKQNHKVIVLHALLCQWQEGSDFRLNEHKDYTWVTQAEFSTLKWCPADREILEILSDPQLEATRWLHH